MKAQSCKEIILPKLIYKLNKIPIKNITGWSGFKTSISNLEEHACELSKVIKGKKKRETERPAAP